jgi:hypothetical protein
MPQHTTTTGLAEDSVVRVRHRTHFHRVLADAYIHELGESDSQVGAPFRTAGPARYGGENIMPPGAWGNGLLLALRL